MIVRESGVEMGRCELCRYFEHTHNQLGICRRHPPIVDSGHSIDEYRNSTWPDAHQDEWCGEYAPNAEHQSERGVE